MTQDRIRETADEQAIESAVEQGILTSDQLQWLRKQQAELEASGRPASLYEVATESLPPTKLAELQELHARSLSDAARPEIVKPPQLGPYVIVNEVARGAMGIVYRGLHPKPVSLRPDDDRFWCRRAVELAYAAAGATVRVHRWRAVVEKLDRRRSKRTPINAQSARFAVRPDAG